LEEQGKKMTRIFIIGGAGSGKTTLGRRISQHFDIPFYEMDLVGWENGSGPERSHETRLHDVHEIAIQPGWVAEGWHRPWTSELLQAADQIVWLDLPWSIARQRIIIRHLRASLAGTNKHRGMLKLYRFLRDVKLFYTSKQPGQNTRLEAAKDLQPYISKIIHCQRPTNVDALLVQIVGATQ
jgi:shikimate kinase